MPDRASCGIFSSPSRRQSIVMKTLVFIVSAIVPSVACAGLLVHEPFAYTPGVSVTGGSAGSGWASSWTQDGAGGSIASSGLVYADAAGNVLNVSGLSATTQSTTTVRNFRSIPTTASNSVWISFLYQIPSGGPKFVGLSFYRAGQTIFAIQSPSTDSTAKIWLGNYVVAGSVSTNKGVFGQTHLIVLRVQKGVGAGGNDVVDAYVDPLLTAEPSGPVSISASNFDFDSVRMAGQDGSPLMLDEIRIGTTYADVTPHTSPQVADTDGDGISDAREIELGLDPLVSNSALISAIRQNPGFFGLYDSAGILSLHQGGKIFPRTGNSSVDFSFDLEYSSDLGNWSPLQKISRSIQLPSNKNFLRLSLGEP